MLFFTILCSCVCCRLFFHERDQ